jgi:hypothetical protein
VIIADDELLPERHGRKVRVPLNSNGSELMASLIAC